MGEVAHKTVSLSLRGYIEDGSAYSEVSDLSDILVSMSDEAEDKAFELIARFQPVASDLRILKSYMKIAYDFTRYGRYALDVSQICEKLGGLRNCENWVRESIEKMAEEVLGMVRVSVDSLRTHDPDVAIGLSTAEKKVDEMYFEYLDRLVEKAPAANKCMISSVLVVRYLERIADHATYIGESIIYLTKGQRITLR
jgi:phosphate transport system protein